MNKAETARQFAQQTIKQQQTTTSGSHQQQPDETDRSLQEFLEALRTLSEKTAINQPILREIIQQQENVRKDLKANRTYQKVLVYFIVLTALLNMIGWILF